MKMRHCTILCLVAVMMAVTSCDFFLTVLHDDEVVAIVGNHKLYKSDIVQIVPDGLSAEDSLAVVKRYIDSWASDLVFLDMAEQKLSKEEKDVSKELEDYRRALLKFRYEQLYIDQRLDTDVSEKEITAFYEEHKDDYKLRVPIVKARFLRISADSPNYEIIRKKLPSPKEDDQILVDSLATISADKYTDFSQNWIDMTTLAQEFGSDYGSLLSQMKSYIIETEDDYGKRNIAYITDFIKAGSVAPVDYCADMIKDIIISTRKQALLSTLEQDLLEEARKNEGYIIYPEPRRIKRNLRK